MNCREYRELIDDALDTSLNGALGHRVKLHLEHCTVCRDYYEHRQKEHVALFTAMNAAYADVHLPSGFADNVIAMIALEGARRKPFFARVPRWALIAASLVAMAGFVFAAAVGIRGAAAANQDADAGGEGPNALEVTGSAAVSSVDAAIASSDPVVSFVPVVPSVDSVPTTNYQLETNQGATTMIRKKAAAAALTAAIMAGATPMSVGAVTTNLIDSVEITADTNITVAANEVLKIEYVYGDNPVTVTKSGEGRLEIATSSLTNLSVVVAEGTFASARPAAIPLNDTFRPSLRLDANDANTFEISKSNGTNFLSKVVDADGNGAYFSSWYSKPYVAEEKLNGLGLIDLGTFRNRTTSVPNGHGGMFALYNVGPGKKTSIQFGDVFYVWKDRDDTIDHELIDDKEFNGPCLLGNNPSYHTRGLGGAGNGFKVYSSGMGGSVKANIHIDGQPVLYDRRVPRGFHLYRNRLKDGTSLEVTTIGYSVPYAGGLVLAECVIYSNRLSEAVAVRVEAQLQSKWLGMKVNNMAVRDGAALDVGAFKFKIGTLDVQNGVTIAGMTNLCFDTLTRASSNVVVTGSVKIDGVAQPLMPDLAFAGDAAISVNGTSRVQTVSSTTDSLVKTGAGELLVADPVVSNITVSAGTLSVSPLYVRSAEYHLDSTRADTIDWAETDGKKLISAWHDLEDPSRVFKACAYRKPGYDQTRLIRPPFVTENAVGDKTMVDFGTFANFNHMDGWGGCLDASPSFGNANGLHDYIAVWQDYPEVKNYPLGGDGKEFFGPMIFGMQYHWNRGNGGNGNGFPIHSSTSSPAGMWNPPNTGLVFVDGVEVNGRSDRIGDGVHVLAQRVHSNDGHPGAPIEQLGGSYLAKAYNSEGALTNGVFGGLMIGEVLMFKEYLTDRLRSRISGALCSKWRGDTNEWAYGEVSVAAGATLNHPYADLLLESLDLAGKLSTVSVKPSLLKIEGNDAEVEGMLILSDGGCIDIGYDPVSGFATVKASSVYAEGKGVITITVPSPAAFIGRECRIVETTSVTAAPGFSWKAPSLRGSGVRAFLKTKADGIYLVFEGNGFKFIVK